MQFKRTSSQIIQGMWGSKVDFNEPIQCQLVNTEQKRTKTEEQVIVGEDGKPLLGLDGKPQYKKVKSEKELYPFIPEEQQTIEWLVTIFGRETVTRNLIATFQRIFQQLWFKSAEKEESKFISFLEAEDFGSVRERTSKTISAEIISLLKTPSKDNIAKAMMLQIELGEKLAEEQSAMEGKE